MDLVYIYAHRQDRKTLLERLQWMGVMEIEESELPEGSTSDDFMHPDMEEKAAAFERMSAEAKQALEILNEVVPEARGLLASFSGRREVSAEEFSACANSSRKVMQDCHHLITLQKRRTECAAEQVRIRTAMAQLEPWLELDVPFRFSGTRETVAFIGALPVRFDQAGLAAALSEEKKAEPSSLLFDVEILGVPREQTCIVVICPREQAEQMEQRLRALGFSRPPAVGSLTPAKVAGTETGTADELPAGEYRRLAEQLEALEQGMDAIRQEIETMADRRRAIEMIIDYYTVRADKYRVISRLNHTRETLVITGYVPQPDVPVLREQLEDRLPVVIEVREADPEKAPVKLQNGAFAQPAESITEMYAMPLPSDIDPTPIMSFFYYLFFGMMLSDAGYGLLLVIGSWLLIRKCRPEHAMRRNLQLFMYCGISTVLWGLVFGSFFGDAPEVIARSFFNIEFTMPRLLDPISDAITLLVLSLVLGFAQILAGLGAKFYMQWRSGDRLGACFDTGFWMTALLGFALLALGMVTTPVFQTVGMWMAIGSLAGLVLTQGRKKRGPMKLFSGLASLYDITGYVSDLMSYSRLMALGLTTGVMGSVFNMLGAMFGKGIVGAVAMVIIFIVGHAINFGINALGTYVHSLRLQYVELFSKFYEGGGRMFRPFAFRSKYVRIKEEIKS